MRRSNTATCIPASTWSIMAIRDSWNTISWWRPAPTPRPSGSGSKAPRRWKSTEREGRSPGLTHWSRKNQVSFEVGKYNPGRPLVIDPTLSYSTYLGGNDYDAGEGIAVDSAGNAYVTG